MELGFGIFMGELVNIREDIYGLKVLGLLCAGTIDTFKSIMNNVSK